PPACFKRASIREGPDAQFLLPDLPESRQSEGLDDQEKNDQGSGDHIGQMFHRRGPDRQSERLGGGADDDRQDVDQGRAEERADQATKPADDYHEKQDERLIYIEGLRLRCAEPEEDHHRASDPGDEGGYGEGEELGSQQADAD